MSNCNLIWATKDADSIIGYIARVSNPDNQNNPEVKGLLQYCAKHNHWSIFEHACATIEINTTRDIGRQIIRHRSFSFSEFSQRYADATKLGDYVNRECRMQDNKNRQNSIDSDDEFLKSMWSDTQAEVWSLCSEKYKEALEKGIAKEQARSLLPEGLTRSRLYMTGTLRSWITYCQVRLDPSTQKEHREVAQHCLTILRDVAPITMDAFFGEKHD